MQSFFLLLLLLFVIFKKKFSKDFSIMVMLYGLIYREIIPVKSISVLSCNTTNCGKAQGGEYLCKALYPHGSHRTFKNTQCSNDTSQLYECFDVIHFHIGQKYNSYSVIDQKYI